MYIWAVTNKQIKSPPKYLWDNNQVGLFKTIYWRVESDMNVHSCIVVSVFREFRPTFDLFHNRYHQWPTLDEDAVDSDVEEEIVDVDVVEHDEELSVTTRRNGEATLLRPPSCTLTLSTF
jgi:hypothetical protein